MILSACASLAQARLQLSAYALLELHCLLLGPKSARACSHIPQASACATSLVRHVTSLTDIAFSLFDSSPFSLFSLILSRVALSAAVCPHYGSSSSQQQTLRQSSANYSILEQQSQAKDPHSPATTQHSVLTSATQWADSEWQAAVLAVLQQQ